MVGSEIGVLRARCSDRRIPDRATLEREMDAGTRQRNQGGAKIHWLFTDERSWAKLARSYPRPAEILVKRRSYQPLSTNRIGAFQPLSKGTQAN